MTSPTTKIREGLNKGQATGKKPTRKVPVIPPLSDLLGLRGDIPSLKKLRNLANTAHANVEQIRSAVVAAVADQEEKIRLKYQHYGKSQDDKGRWIDNDSARAERNRVIERETQQMAKEIRAINDQSLRQNMIAVNQVRLKLKTMERWWDNPVKILMRTTIYSDRRATLAATLAHAGPGELIDAAEMALARNDRDLGAAVLTRLENMPEPSRDMVMQVFAESNITRESFSGALVHSLWLEAQATIGMTKLHADSAEQAILEANGQPHKPIAFALRKQAILDELGIATLEEAFATSEPVDTNDTPAPTAHIEKPAASASSYEAQWQEFWAAYESGDFELAKTLAARYGIDVFEDEESNDAQ